MGSESRPQPVSPRQAGCPASQPRAPDSSLGPCGPLQTDEVWEQQVRGRVCPCWASPGPELSGARKGVSPERSGRAAGPQSGKLALTRGTRPQRRRWGLSISPRMLPPRDRPPLCGLRACTPPARTGQGLLCHRGLACVTPSHTPCMLWAGVPALTGKTRPWWGLRASLGGQAPQESDKKHERRWAGSTGVSGTREGGPRGPAAPVGTRGGGGRGGVGPVQAQSLGPAGQGRGPGARDALESGEGWVLAQGRGCVRGHCDSNTGLALRQQGPVLSVLDARVRTLSPVSPGQPRSPLPSAPS